VEPIGDLFYIAAYDGYAQVAWNTNTTGIEDLYIGYIPNIRNGQTVGDTMAWGDSNNSAGGWAPLPPQFVPGQSWVIATTTPVPEPASLTLLISALLGFAGAFYLRRRRAKA